MMMMGKGGAVLLKRGVRLRVRRWLLSKLLLVWWNLAAGRIRMILVRGVLILLNLLLLFLVLYLLLLLLLIRLLRRRKLLMLLS